MKLHILVRHDLAKHAVWPTCMNESLLVIHSAVCAQLQCIVLSTSCHHPDVRYRSSLAKSSVCAFKKVKELLRSLDGDRIREVTFLNHEELRTSEATIRLVIENRTGS